MNPLLQLIQQHLEANGHHCLVDQLSTGKHYLTVVNLQTDTRIVVISSDNPDQIKTLRAATAKDTLQSLYGLTWLYHEPADPNFFQNIQNVIEQHTKDNTCS